MKTIISSAKVKTYHINDSQIYVWGGFWYSNVFYSGESACQLINKWISKEANPIVISCLLKEFNGSFAFCIKNESRIIGAVDRLRSYPLYYNKAEGIADRVDKLDLSNNEIDRLGYIEILSSGYSVNNRTIIKNWKSLLPGQFIIIDTNKTIVYSYYKHEHKISIDITPDFVEKQILSISQRVIERAIKSLNGKKILLPLSGGYDSRYIACMLKEYGFSDVVTYTYGTSTSYEVKSSHEIASKLGLEWNFIEYKDTLYKEIIGKNVLNDFFDFSFTGNGIPCVQEIAALYKLSQEYEPNEYCILPGYCGDLFGGSYLFPFLKDEYTHNEIAVYLYNKHFIFRNNSRIERMKTLDDIKRFYQNEEKMIPYSKVASINENWFINHKVAKFVVNAVRMFEFYGYSWWMPLWDNDLMEMWYQVPLLYRGQEMNLYKDILFRDYFKKYGIDEFLKPASFSKKPSTGIALKAKESIKEVNAFLKMNANISLIPRKDINNSNYITTYLFDNISDKKRICYRNSGANGLIARKVLSKFESKS